LTKTQEHAPPAERRATKVRRTATTYAALAGLTAGSLVALASSASAAANPYERGPAPTTASLEATTGPFATAKTSVGWASGFGGGTIYYPTDTTAGTFGVVAVAPGFTEGQSVVSWYGPRIASQGFVVITIDTITSLDQPDSRGRQLLAALDYVANTSSVASRVDKTRMAVMGHSMGGGGSLEASKSRPGLKAAIPLTGWDLNTNLGSDNVPTLVVAAQNDLIAPTFQHSVPFYNNLPGAGKKTYLELAGAGHLAPNSPNVTIAKFSIAWLKRWVDNDTRYSPFLCNVSAGGAISSFRSTCPF
jgi:dienelactone hydrolase